MDDPDALRAAFAGTEGAFVLAVTAIAPLVLLVRGRNHSGLLLADTNHVSNP